MQRRWRWKQCHGAATVFRWGQTLLAHDWTTSPSCVYNTMVKKLDGQDILNVRENLPAGSSEQLQAIMTAGRAIHAAVATLDAAVADRIGVPRNDLRCLHLLKYGPVSAGEIAARTGLTSGSVTALIDRLEAGGYVERQRSTADRRSVAIAMSDCRAQDFKAIGTEIEQAIQDCFGDRTPAEIAAAGAALGMFAAVLEQCAERLNAAPKSADAR